MIVQFGIWYTEMCWADDDGAAGQARLFATYNLNIHIYK